jgi:SAM-dependent methyltransferase
MTRVGKLLSGTLTGGEGYYDYEVELGRRVVVPWLERRLALRGLAVGDLGCHAGGLLHAFREQAGIASGEGFDLDERAIRNSPFPADERFRIGVGNILDVQSCVFHLVVLHDVLEHVPQRDAVLAACVRSLRPGGALFVSFPPYYSPFGGHQQVSSNWARLAPYLHLLPRRLFFRLLQLTDNEYLSAEQLRADLTSIRTARLTIAGAEAAFAAAGLRCDSRQLFLLRPEYAIRYGIAPLDAGPIGRIRGLRELLVMGAFYLLRAPAG